MKLNIPKVEEIGDTFSLPELIGLKRGEFRPIAMRVDELFDENSNAVDFIKSVYNEFNNDGEDDAKVFIAMSYAMDVLHSAFKGSVAVKEMVREIAGKLFGGGENEDRN